MSEIPQWVTVAAGGVLLNPPRPSGSGLCLLGLTTLEPADKQCRSSQLTPSAPRARVVRRLGHGWRFNFRPGEDPGGAGTARAVGEVGAAGAFNHQQGDPDGVELSA